MAWLRARGSTARRPANERRYAEYREAHRSSGCAFCALVDNPSDEVVEDTKQCLVIVSMFGYDFWDDCGVSEHLMVIPKRHVESLAELDDAERVDYMNTIAEQQVRGYSLYARAPSSITGSVAHQHTHLIKIDNVRKKWLIFLRKPHVLWMR